MKTLLSYCRVTCLLFACMLIVVSAQAQFRFKQPLKYGNDRDDKGHFFYTVQIVRYGGDNSWIETDGPLEVDMAGANAGKLRFYINNEKIDICRSCRLEVRSVCHAGGTAHLKPKEGEIVVLERGAEKRGSIEFNIVKNGSGQLTIGFGATKRDEELKPCDQQISVSYTITGLVEPDVEACKAALTAFDNNKMGSIPRLQELVSSYPNAPCRDRISAILAEYDLYIKAKNAEHNCSKLKTIHDQYVTKFGKSGYFYVDIAAFIAKCPTKTVVTTVPIPVEKSPEDKDWAHLQKSDKTEDYLAYLGKYPDSKNSAQVRSYLSRVSPIRVEENRVSDLKRSYKLTNAVNPRYKDMSLGYGLKVNATDLTSANAFTATLEKPGEYAVRILDEMGKDTIININSSFSGEMSALPDGRGYFVKISGGQKPYTVLLEDLETNIDRTLIGSLKTDTLTITLEYLNQRNLTRQYQLKVKSFNASSAIELGAINNTDQGFDPTNIILLLLGALVATCCLYLIYSLLRTRKARRKKRNTIYDQVNH